jgi:hypothetical protein
VNNNLLIYPLFVHFATVEELGGKDHV